MGLCCSCCKKKKDNTSNASNNAQTLNQWDPKAVTFSSSPSHMQTDEITTVYYSDTDDIDRDKEYITAMEYQIKRQINSGASGVVSEAVSLVSDKQVAIKRVDMTVKYFKYIKAKRGVKNELFVIQKTRHPHIVQMYNHFLIKRHKTQSVYIVMEYMPRGDLSEFVRKKKPVFDEITVKRMFAQIVSAVRHMHDKHIAHRDLKMGNILIDDQLNIKVADFGMSIVAYRKSKGFMQTNVYCGTPEYIAPEILISHYDKGKYYNPFPTDIWALGVLLFVMVNRKYPIDKNQSRRKMLAEMKNLNEERLFRRRLSDGYCDIIKQILVFDPKQRITMNQLCEHYWVSEEIDAIRERIAAQEVDEK